MERLFKFKNFRNIGVKGEETLLINTSLIKGEMGTVVTLIGENNLGKSSIIDGVRKYGENSINKAEDVYDNEFEENLIPTITLIVRDGKNEFYHDKMLNKQDDVNGYKYILADSNESIVKEMYSVLKEFEQIFSTKELTVRNPFYNTVASFINHSKEINSIEKFKAVSTTRYNELMNEVNYIKSNISGYSVEISKEIDDSDIDLDKLIEYLRDKSQGYATEFRNAFKNKYDFEFEPTIYQYKQTTRLTDANLKSVWNYANGSIIDVVLNYIGFKKEAINKAYTIAQQNGADGPLKNLEKQVNAKMKGVDKKFNAVFRTDDTSYSFRFKFEAEYIRLIVSCGEKDLVIKRNSEGFSWFFNFFFNFIIKYEPKPGDIILMDDEGYGLMPQGIHELHKYLREYAKKKDVTVIIATCNEHFVDLNYLDEIRIIERFDEDKARINSKITLFNDGDIDALKQIKKAIMVNGNIFDSDDVQQIYVEGITDYNYLTAFAILLKINDLVFIPFNGVKREDVEIKLRRRNHTNVFLVDGDKEGLAFKDKINKNGDSIVFSINEADDKFKTIEDLFKEEELLKFGLKDKSYDNSCNFKQNILKYSEDISQETKNNFKKLLDYINE